MTEFVLDRFLPYQLAVAASRTSREFSALYQDRFGIGIAEWRVVAHLSQGGPVSVREIHERVEMDKSRVSRAAARLETAGYVLKRINTADRRLVELSLTEKGQAMMDEIARMAAAFEASLAERLGPNARAFRASLDTYLSSDEGQIP